VNESSFSGALNILSYILLSYFLILFLFGIGALHQEAKVWSHPSLPSISLIGLMKAYAALISWMLISLIGGVIFIPKYIFCGPSSVEDDIFYYVERVAAIFMVKCFVGSIQIHGQEKILPDRTPCVYIANHSSLLDPLVCYFLSRRIRYIAKKQFNWVPGAGLVMLMSGHITIDRNKKNKNEDLNEKCKKTLRKGVQLFIFPEGTRNLAERIPFRDGAFRIATMSEVPLVPISIEVPLTAWNSFYPFSLFWKSPDPVVITVHDPIVTTKDSDIKELKKRAEKVIYSVLPNHGHDKTS